jgi:glutaredoxin-related protein
VSFPLLADFHPKGEVAQAYGMYGEHGESLRATVIVDASGKVAYSQLADGQRDMEALLKIARDLDAAYAGDVEDAQPPEGLPADVAVFVKSNCGFSRAVLTAMKNLHLEDLEVRNVTDDADAMERLKERTGKEQAPALCLEGEVMLESRDIIRTLLARTTRL